MVRRTIVRVIIPLLAVSLAILALVRPVEEVSGPVFSARDKGEKQTPAPEKTVFEDFETAPGSWRTLSGPAATVSGARASRGRRSLLVPARAEREAVVSREGNFDWFERRALSIDLHAPEKAAGVEVYLAVKDDEHFWYQSRKPFEVSGGWQTFLFDLTGSADDSAFVPAGHYRPWSGDIAHSLEEIQVRLQAKSSLDSDFFIDNLQLFGESRPPAGEALFISGLGVNENTVGLHEKFEVSFNLSRRYRNPYDPEEITVEGVFLSPDGEKVRVPGFFYQPYERRLARGREELVPAGSARWVIRFAPRSKGRHQFYLRAADRHETLRSDTWSFEAVDSGNPGYARVSPADERYFEFGDGSFFYPVGLNVISPWDTPYGQDYVETPPVGLGTYAFDHYLERMETHGINFFRMWMSYWWVALEWTPENGPYHGLGRYSQSNAWRLDYILEKAREKSVYILLTLNNHTMLTGGWGGNPHNVLNGGFLEHPGDFFSDEKARELFRRRLRYIVARWGYSTSVFAWDFWSEVDLTDGYQRRNQARTVGQWHEEMADYLKQIDPFGHMVTTHFCYPSRALEWGELPASFDFLHSNSYVNVDRLPGVQVEAVAEYWRRMKVLGSPAFISEYGGHWALSEDEVLHRDLHAGLWSAFMTPMAASPQFWWWNFVDDRDLYYHYRALSRFAQGEDRRGKNLSVIGNPVIENDESGRLMVSAMGNGEIAFAWVYNFLAVERVGYGLEEITGAEMVIPGMVEGKYRVEFWDTRSGMPFKNEKAISREGKLRVPLPAISKDIACKIKPL